MLGDVARAMSLDVATACDVGQRSSQEDAIICDFAEGASMGFVVLADGMGGHAAGEVASGIVAEQTFCALRAIKRSGRIPQDLGILLRQIVMWSNGVLADRISKTPEINGMGTTVLAATVRNATLHWISVGDSPLYLFRDGVLRQLNQDHSLAPQIDLLVASGLMDAEEGRNHPDRNMLMSVMSGREIFKIDCPAAPIALYPGDIVIAASDGLQTLDHAQLEFLLLRNHKEPSSIIVSRLLAAVAAVGDPEQDNTTFSVIRMADTPPIATQVAPPVMNVKEATPKVVSFLRNHFPTMIRHRPSATKISRSSR